MRLADFFGNTIHKAPHIIRRKPCFVALRRILAHAKRALADCSVAIRRHHRDHTHIVMIELRTNKTNRLLEQFLIGVAKLIILLDFKTPLPAIHPKPIGMRRKHLFTIRHRIEPVGVLNAIRIAHTQPHKPHRIVAAMHSAVITESTLGEVGPYSFVDLWQLD